MYCSNQNLGNLYQYTYNICVHNYSNNCFRQKSITKLSSINNTRFWLSSVFILINWIRESLNQNLYLHRPLGWKVLNYKCIDMLLNLNGKS